MYHSGTTFNEIPTVFSLWEIGGDCYKRTCSKIGFGCDITGGVSNCNESGSPSLVTFSIDKNILERGELFGV